MKSNNTFIGLFFIKLMGRLIFPFMKALAGEKDPNLDLPEFKGMNPKQRMEFLMQSGNMKGKYLGACLDSCRWGSTVSVMWETDVRGLMGFIQKWRDENNDNPSLYHELKLEEAYTRFELPHINHESCPRNKFHGRTFVDNSGKVRCGHRDVSGMRPSFLESYEIFDELSQMSVQNIYERAPEDPSSWDEEGKDLTDKEDYDRYLKLRRKYLGEEKSLEVVDVCYAILSDKNLVLPFETILTRLNRTSETRTAYCEESSNGPIGCKRLDEVPANRRDFYSFHCQGHDEPNKQVVFGFDGWDLAFYLQRWREQDNGKAPWFADRKEHWTPKPLPACD